MAVDLSVSEPETISFVWHTAIPRRYVTILAGDPGAGKSLVGLALAVAGVARVGLLGSSVAIERVIYADFERLGRGMMTNRARRIARGFGLDAVPSGVMYESPRSPLTTEQGRDAIVAAIAACNADMLIVDSFSAAAPSADLLATSSVMPVMDFLASLPCTTVVVDHLPKMNAAIAKSGLGRQPFGSVAKIIAARSVLQLAQNRDGMLTIKQTKSNFAAPMPPLSFAIEHTDDTIILTSAMPRSSPKKSSGRQTATKGGMTAAHKAIVTALRKRGPSSAAELNAATGYSRKTVWNRTRELIAAGRVMLNSEGMYALPESP